VALSPQLTLPRDLWYGVQRPCSQPYREATMAALSSWPSVPRPRGYATRISSWSHQNLMIHGVHIEVLEISPHLSITTTFGDPYSFLCITLSVFPLFPPDRTVDLLPQYVYFLCHRGGRWRWKACRTVRVASDRIPPKLTVSF
jgi:hypothetical protein